MTDIQLDSVRRLLGFPGRMPAGHGGRTERVVRTREMVVEDVVVETDAGPVPGTLMRSMTTGKNPAVLYCHAHGNQYDIGRRELLESRPALLSAYGPALVQMGFVVLCLDMPGFNDRKGEGSESALSKSALWHGQTLFGRMLADLSAGLDYLMARDDVDAQRVATLGLSMGATHAYWLAALDHRVSRVAHLCAFSNMRPLIESAAHDLHGHYMTVPGLLEQRDMADIAAAIAPRPQLVCCGAKDPLTPPEALEPAVKFLRQAYQRADASDALEVIVEPETGHKETPAMREAVLAFLGKLAGFR